MGSKGPPPSQHALRAAKAPRTKPQPTKPPRQIPPRRSAKAQRKASANAEKTFRKDVKKRAQYNKSRDFFVVKKALHQFTKPEGAHLEWAECIVEMNRAVAEAYLLANFYVLRELEHGRPLLELDQRFYQTCLSLVTNRERRVADKELQAAKLEFNAMRESPNDMANTKYLNQGWFQCAAKTMASNAQNYMVANFAKRMRNYVIDCFGATRQEAHKIVNLVFCPDIEAKLSQEFMDERWGRTQVIESAAVYLHTKVPRKPNGKVNWAPHLLLPLFYEFLQYAEECNTANEGVHGYKTKRQFCLLPTKQGYRASYCKVDSTGLRSLLLRSPRVYRSLSVEHNGQTWTLGESLHEGAPWIAMSELWWRMFFRVDDIKGSFHREISTDGYAVSAHMDRPTTGKKKRKRRKIKQRSQSSNGSGAHDNDLSDALGFPCPTKPMGKTDEYDTVWGIDPGWTDFITAVDQDGRSVRFRTTDFRRSSGYCRSNRKSRHRIAKQLNVQNLLRATQSKKTASLEEFKAHVQFWFAHGPRLLHAFMDPTAFFRKLRFRRYKLRSAQLDRACFELSVAPGSKTIVGFGDHGTAGQGVIKGCVAGPVKEFARKLARLCEVVVIDEYLTSKVHHDCAATSYLENQRVQRTFRDGSVHNVRVHKVLHCLGRRGGCGRTVDRDVNAAKNIRSVLQSMLLCEQRPSRLQRPHSNALQQND